MSNLLEYINKTQTINAKAEVIYNQIQEDYNSGIIKTETEMLYRLKQALKGFYASIGKPTFSYIPASSTPISADYNSMIQNAYNDIKIIIDECTNLSGAIDSDFIDIELSRTMLSNQVNYANKRLSDLQNKIEVNNDSNVVLFTDSFINTNYTELTLIDAGFTMAFVNTIDGALTLSTDTSSESSVNSYVEILNDSNGFPGNTHMVDVLDNDLHFLGDNGLHMDLTDIVDGNIDTWFEYELFNMDDTVIDKCNNFGLSYKENLFWVTDDSVLTLKLKVSIQKPTTCNWLSLTPYITENIGANASIIKSITISDGDSVIQKLDITKVFNDKTAIIFNPQVVSFVIVEFEQRASYNTNVGHFYFTKSDTPNLLIFDDVSSSKYSRVDGPNPTIELLGMKYDPTIKASIQPKNYNDNTKIPTIIDTANIKNKLFSLPADTSTSKSNKEMVSAYRYSIGIRNMSISSFSFQNNCEYISKPFTTNDYITSISLDADELIPVEFTNTGTDAWIQYAITLDNCVTWIPIFPLHRAFEGPCTIKINSELPASQRNPNKLPIAKAPVFYIDRLIEPTSLRLKIILTRPSTYPTMTPVVYDYKLKVLTGGGSVEY